MELIVVDFCVKVSYTIIIKSIQLLHLRHFSPFGQQLLDAFDFSCSCQLVFPEILNDPYAGSDIVGKSDEQHPKPCERVRPSRADLRKRVLNMFFRPKRKFAVLLSPAERKLIRYCLMELRNKLALEVFDTEDVDVLILRLA